jgi:hypothetical protein
LRHHEAFTILRMNRSDPDACRFFLSRARISVLPDWRITVRVESSNIEESWSVFLRYLIANFKFHLIRIWKSLWTGLYSCAM